MENSLLFWLLFQNISDIMISFLFGYMCLSYNFRSIEAFSKFKCFELTLI